MSGNASMSKSHPSHQKVACGYCSKIIRRDKLKPHTSTFHRGLPPMEKNQRNIRGESAQDILKAHKQRQRQVRENQNNVGDQREVSDQEEVQGQEEEAEQDEVRNREEAAEQEEVQDQEEFPYQEDVQRKEDVPVHDEVQGQEEVPDPKAVQGQEEFPNQEDVQRKEEVPDPKKDKGQEEIQDQGKEGIQDQEEALLIRLYATSKEHEEGDSKKSPTRDGGQECDEANQDKFMPALFIGLRTQMPLPLSIESDRNPKNEPLSQAESKATEEDEAGEPQSKRRRIHATSEDQSQAMKMNPGIRSGYSQQENILERQEEPLTRAHFDKTINDLKGLLGGAFRTGEMKTSPGPGRIPECEVLTVPLNPASENKGSTMEEVKKGMMINAKSFNDIIRIYPEFSSWYSDDETLLGLKCKPCTAHTSSSTKQLGNLKFEAASVPGCAGYEMNPSPTTEWKTQVFRNLKKKVVTHIDSEAHLKNTEDFVKIEQKAAELAPRNEAVAARLARCALRSCIEDKSQSQFEKEVAHLASCGVDVGTLNHSRNFAAQMHRHFADSLRSQLQLNLYEPQPASGRPPPFSVICDAMTPNRDTVQITGIVTNFKGRQTDLFLKASVIKSHSGEEFAKVIHQDLSTQLGLTDEELRRRLIGVAGDGQYIRNHAPELLAERLGIHRNEWISRHWDPAHILELCEKNAREGDKEKVKGVKQKEDNKNKWVDKLLSTINDLHSRHKIGSGWRELQEISGGCTRAVNNFSATRFAAHSHRVFENFKVNYPAMYLKLSKQKRSDDLHKIDNAHFILRVTGLSDIYREFSKCSKELQNPKNFPWIVCDTVATGIQSLKEMSLELEEAGIKESLKMKCFADAVSELLGSNTYADMPIYNRVKGPTAAGTRSRNIDPSRHHSSAMEAVKTAKQDLSRFITTLCLNMEGRFKEQFDSNQSTQFANEAFSTNAIIQSEFDSNVKISQDTSFSKYADLAKSNGYLEIEGSSLDLITQYGMLRQKILKDAKEFLGQSVITSGGSILKMTADQERDFLSQFTKESTNFENCKDAGHLLLSGMARTHCEAVVEGMGNVLDRRLQNRGSIGLDKLSEETFISWNLGNSASAPRELLLDSLERRFGKDRKDWHVVKQKDQPGFVQASSKVVRRIQSKEGRIIWGNE